MSGRNQSGTLETAVQEALAISKRDQHKRSKRSPELRQLLSQVSAIMDDIGQSLRENHERARESHQETERTLYDSFTHIGAGVKVPGRPE